MNYDRSKQAGAYDKYLSKAVSDAKSYWGAGWANLTPTMRNAFVCHFLVGNLAGIDFEVAFGSQIQTPTEEKLFSRLKDLSAMLEAATGAE